MSTETWPRMRPPEERPPDRTEVLIRTKSGHFGLAWFYEAGSYWIQAQTEEINDWTDDELVGWWPLPEIKKGRMTNEH